MSSILQILNGDSTLYGFEHTALDGDILVWREVLSEGPLTENIESAAFWQQRAEWITKTFDETPDGYDQAVMHELQKINQPYNEINLWFEFDLHCQINLLGVMMLLSQQTDSTERAIYLICPDSYPGKPDFRGMGELTGAELEYLYDNIRVQLSGYDFDLAAEAWDVYITNDIITLKNWLATDRFWANMTALKPALQAHLQRLEVNAIGLNYIEQKLIDIYYSGITDKAAIYNEFWRTEKIYGIGDKQLDVYWDELKDKALI
ncbi:DUF1835 domain-containing protein [Mucilaginibacter litoreus]|uniref:DUF1835 domain-containing protein n=1 Tax=Mucilaginibacter litoreus TaxID=1048221 RepID=A0ABW3AYA1_9SPHI